MSTRLLNAMANAQNYALTENGAIARATTGSEVLNFFSHGGALRGPGASRAVPLFDKAWGENPELALKAMFYFRDVRGGQGQRKAFRDQLVHLAKIAPKTARKNLEYVADYGRWDDLYTLFGTKLEADVLDIFKNQLVSDIKALQDGEKSISLLAKWLKSENASSKETKVLATKTRKALGLSSRDYRKTLSKLREHLDVVERHTSAREWDEITYESVPSQAMMKYRKAFKKNDEKRFSNFIEKVHSGEAKLNATTLYPYQIVDKCFAYNGDSRELDAMWKSLPDYVAGADEKSIAVVDVSGSMTGMPMNVAISLGIYMAERSSGPYKDHFITFSDHPTLEKVVGSNIVDKVRNLSRAAWEMSTNIEAVFMLILNTAIKNKLEQSEMLDKIYIISDMEFNRCTNANKTLFNTLRQRFTQAGYEMPQLVFWNVDARNDQLPMSMDDRGFVNVSGFSPSIFASLMSGEMLDAYGMMLKVLQSERYAPLTV